MGQDRGGREPTGEEEREKERQRQEGRRQSQKACEDTGRRAEDEGAGERHS